MKSVSTKVGRSIRHAIALQIGFARWKMAVYIEAPIEDLISLEVWSNVSVATREQLKRL